MLDRMLGGDEAVREAAMGFVLATAMVALTIALIGFLPLYADQFRRIWGFPRGATADRMVTISRVDWLIAAIRGGILMAILWTMRRMKPVLALALLAAFVLLDLGPVVHQLNPRMPAAFFTKNPDVDATLPKNRADYRVFHEADWYGQEEISRKYFSTGDAVYWIVRNGLFPMTPAGHRVRTVLERDYDKTALLPTIDLTDSVWDVKRNGRKDWWKPFVAMSNAWYRGVYRPYDAERTRVNGNMKAASPVELEPVGHNPRYYFADQVVTIRDRADFVRKLTARTYSPKVAFVKERLAVDAGGTVHGYVETANRASIDVDSAGNAFLVMSVTPHKYWTVTIDGRKAQPVVTNIGYQGVRVPAGRHRVEMRYRNTLVDRGAVISVLATLLLAVAALLRPHRPPHAAA
jgi:hypothetical protein